MEIKRELFNCEIYVIKLGESMCKSCPKYKCIFIVDKSLKSKNYLMRFFFEIDVNIIRGTKTKINQRKSLNLLNVLIKTIQKTL